MKKLIAILLLLHSACFGQQTIPAVGNATSLWHTGGMLTSDVNFRLPHTKHCIPFFDSTGNLCYINDTVWVHNGTIWVPNTSSGGGVSQIYNYFGTTIHGGDSVKVDTTLIQPKIPYTTENTANKIGSGGTPNSTNYYSSAAVNTLNAAIYGAITDSVLGRVKYSDSVTLYVTPKNLHDTSAGIYTYIQALPSFGITSTNITHWNTAYNKSISGLGFSGGTFTFTSLDATTQTVSLDGRYLKTTDTTGLWLGAGTPVVLTTGSYSNPSWISSLAYSKLTGTPSIPTVSGSLYGIPVFNGTNSIGNSNIYDSTALGHSGVTDTFTLSSYVYLKNTPPAVLADSILVKGATKGTVRVAGPPTGAYPIVYTWPGNNVSLATTGTAGTYGSATSCPVIQTDQFGRVYSASNATITPDWLNVQNRPTTVQAYSITDVYTKTTSDGKYASSITLNTTGVLYTSPVTYTNNGSGSFTGSLTLASQSANMVFRSGAGGTPTFSALLKADLPADVAYTDVNQSWTKAQSGAIVEIAYSATVTPDFNLGNAFKCPLTGNLILGTPINLTEGQPGVIFFYQDSVGSRLLSSSSWAWNFQGALLPTFTTTKGLHDALSYTVVFNRTSTVTMSIANPGVVTWNGHGLYYGTKIQFTTTGALPTGVTANTTYWVINRTANTFQLASSEGSTTGIQFSGSQSGTHTGTAIQIDAWLTNALH